MLGIKKILFIVSLLCLTGCSSEEKAKELVKKYVKDEYAMEVEIVETLSPTELSTGNDYVVQKKDDSYFTFTVFVDGIFIKKIDRDTYLPDLHRYNEYKKMRIYANEINNLGFEMNNFLSHLSFESKNPFDFEDNKEAEIERVYETLEIAKKSGMPIHSVIFYDEKYVISFKDFEVENLNDKIPIVERINKEIESE